MIINRYAKGGGLSPRIVVTSATGSTVTCTKGGTTLTATEVSGKWTFNLNDFGTWTVSATLGDKSKTQDVDVVWAQVYEVTLLFVDATLDNNDWETIKQVADASTGPNYWSVGDTKQITINGKLSDGLTLSNYQMWVYIIGFDHNSTVEGTGIAFQGFKTAQTGGVDVALCDSGYSTYHSSGQWFNMNNSSSNAGGWASSLMRTTTIPVVKATLPNELVSVIKTTTIYTDNTVGGSDTASDVTATQDDLYLLADFEIFGARTYANSAEQNYQKQYAYYVSGNSKVKYRHDSTATAVYWWERSAYATSPSSFCIVRTNGIGNYNDAYYSRGLAPAFKVGSNPPPQPIGNLAVGNIVKVKESGTDVDYIIVQQGNPDTTMYDASCNGTWLLRKDSVASSYMWSTAGEYSGSVVDNYLKNTFVGTLNISNIIKTVKIPYVSSVRITTENPYTISSGSDGLLEQAFLLSCVEIGGAVSDNYGAPADGAKLDYFNLSNASDNKRIAYYGSTARNWWTRSPSNYQNYYAWRVDTTGSIFYSNANEDNNGVRPAFIIPSDTMVAADGAIQA